MLLSNLFMKLAPVHLPEKILIFKNGPNTASFCIFLFVSPDKYSTTFTTNEKIVDGVFGTRTQCGRMVGADESTELWRHKKISIFLCTGARRHRSRRPPPSPRGRADFPIRYLRPRLGSGRFGLSALRTAGNWSRRDQRGQRLRNPNSNNIISSDILGIVMLCLIHICCWYTMRIPTCFENTYWDHLRLLIESIYPLKVLHNGISYLWK